MSRATFAVDMWSMIAPAALGAGARRGSGRRAIQACSSSGVSGNANGVKYGSHCLGAAEAAQRACCARCRAGRSRRGRSARAPRRCRGTGRRTTREVDARAARPARVEEQRADPVRRVGGRQPDERDRDRRAARAVVVERHLHACRTRTARPKHLLQPTFDGAPTAGAAITSVASAIPTPVSTARRNMALSFPWGRAHSPTARGGCQPAISPGRCAPPRRSGPRSASRPARGSSRTAAAPRPCRRARPARRGRRSTPSGCAPRARR